MEKALISELTQGMDLVRQLGFRLNSSPIIDETHQQLLQRILSTYEKSLFILQWGNVVATTTTTHDHHHPTANVVPPQETCSSPEASPQSDHDVSVDRATTDVIHVSKKRKGQPVWTNQVRILTENGLEGNIGDGFSWRKYGQKDILGAKYPRSYYRCTYRSVHDCWATKYLQRSDEDPCVFDITYRGNHNCTQQQSNVINNNPDQQQQAPNDNIYDPLANLRANLRVNVNNDRISDDHFNFPSTTTSLGYNNFNFSNRDLSRVLCPPAPTRASSSNNFSLITQLQINNFAVSTDIPRNNSESHVEFPLEGLDHGQEQEENIQFDNSGFFASYDKQ